MKIQNQPTAALRKRRDTLLRQLPPLQAILRGSLIERYKRCGKPGCKCAEGPGHGPKYYLSVSYPGVRPQMDYVPQESYALTAEFLANYQRSITLRNLHKRAIDSNVSVTRGATPARCECFRDSGTFDFSPWA